MLSAGNIHRFLTMGVSSMLVNIFFFSITSFHITFLTAGVAKSIRAHSDGLTTKTGAFIRDVYLSTQRLAPARSVLTVSYIISCLATSNLTEDFSFDLRYVRLGNKVHVTGSRVRAGLL